MKYRVRLSLRAQEDLAHWRVSGQRSTVEKIIRLLDELSEHPRTGTGKPEQLSRNHAGLWSRRIDKKNRLVYSIDDNVVLVQVISASGHYNDR